MTKFPSDDWLAAWETEDNYWYENFSSRPYAIGADYYDRFRPAYRYGFESATHGLGRLGAVPAPRRGLQRLGGRQARRPRRLGPSRRHARHFPQGPRRVAVPTPRVAVADSIRDLFFGTPANELVEAIEPRRTFDDVVLPETTLLQLNHALALVRKHDLIFRQWGLAERHSSGLGLAFHFAGPPGTGKTICAEALAYALDQRLLVVRYSELESRWVGQTAKHVASVFRAAERQNAVLFFDEADAIAGRRFTSLSAAYEREANAVVNVLLHEVENFDGVVIFATNLAANIDPAFERRIRTHIRFDMPNTEERERIWQVQLHARKTPLADDVNFRELAERYPRSGGDIKNAVLKAAQIATTEPGPDAQKRIHQRHFIQGMEEVLAGEAVMSQSLFDLPGPVAQAAGVLEQMAEGQEQLRAELGLVAERLDQLERGQVRLQTEPRPRPSQAPLWVAIAAVLFAAAALAVALLSP
jgi:ATP-dependent 26S proteasome regulatory subunit